jgi:hypothetical protein
MVMQNSRAGGARLATTVNRTPPFAVPVAFPNLAQLAAAIPNVPNIFLAGGNAQNLYTLTPVSNGDEGGSLGGVASGVFVSVSQNVVGSNTVLIGGGPVTRMTDPTAHNLYNAIGIGVAPSQTKVFVFAP